MAGEAESKDLAFGGPGLQAGDKCALMNGALALVLQSGELDLLRLQTR